MSNLKVFNQMARNPKYLLALVALGMGLTKTASGQITLTDATGTHSVPLNPNGITNIDSGARSPAPVAVQPGQSNAKPVDMPIHPGDDYNIGPKTPIYGHIYAAAPGPAPVAQALTSVAASPILGARIPSSQPHYEYRNHKQVYGHWVQTGKKVKVPSKIDPKNPNCYTTKEVPGMRWVTDQPPAPVCAPTPVAAAAPLPAEAPAPVERIVREVHEHETIKYMNSYHTPGEWDLVLMFTGSTKTAATPGAHGRSPIVLEFTGNVTIEPVQAPCPWLALFGIGVKIRLPWEKNSEISVQDKDFQNFKHRIFGTTANKIPDADFMFAFKKMNDLHDKAAKKIMKDRKHGDTNAAAEVAYEFAKEIYIFSHDPQTNPRVREIVKKIIFTMNDKWDESEVENLRNTPVTPLPDDLKYLAPYDSTQPKQADNQQGENENLQLPTPRTAADAQAGVLTPSATLAEPPAAPEQPSGRRQLPKSVRLGGQAEKDYEIDQARAAAAAAAKNATQPELQPQ